MDDIGIPYNEEEIEQLTIINNLVANISKGEGKYCAVDYEASQVVYSDMDEMIIKHNFETLEQCIDMLLDIYSEVKDAEQTADADS